MRLRRLSGWLNLLLAAVLLLAAWVLVSLLASQPACKHLFDLTPRHNATVTDVTEELVAELRKRDLHLDVHVFFHPLSSRPPNEYEQARWDIRRTLQNLTRDLLRHYSYLGGAAVRVKEYDTAFDVEHSREVALRYSLAQDEDQLVLDIGGRHRKLSLTSDLGDIERPQAVPFGPQPLPRLRNYKGEEALSSAIKSILATGTPKVYFLTGYSTLNPSPGSTVGAGYSELLAMLQREGLELAELPLKQTQQIPADASALALLEPDVDFTDAEADLLVGWLQGGGRMFIDYGWVPVPDHNLTGGPLGARLGFAVSEELVLQLVRAGAEMVSGLEDVKNVTGLFSPSHPTTAVLGKQALALKQAREIRRTDRSPSSVRMEPIVRTLPGWCWLSLPHVGADGNLRPDLRAPQRRDQDSHDLGVVLDIDGPGGKTGHLVLLAGVALNNLGLKVNGAGFASNVFNFMVDRKVLLQIPGDRYHVEHVQLGLDQVANIQWLLLLGVPGLFLLLGVLVYWRRSRWR